MLREGLDMAEVRRQPLGPDRVGRDHAVLEQDERFTRSCFGEVDVDAVGMDEPPGRYVGLSCHDALLISSAKGRGSNNLISRGRSRSSMSRRCRGKAAAASVISPISAAELSAAAGDQPGSLSASAHAEL